jgi:hypothetical protein
MSVREKLEDACESGNLQLFEETLREVDFGGYFKQLAFRLALRYEQMEMLKFLVETVGISDLWLGKGEQSAVAVIIVMRISKRNSDEERAFLLNVIRYFLEERGIDPNSLPITNETEPRYAIDIAALRGADNVVNLFLEYGADVQPTGIMVSAVNGFMELSKLLISHATPEVINEALTLCSSKVSARYLIEISQLLLDYGADPSFITEGKGEELQTLREYIPINPRRVRLCCA